MNTAFRPLTFATAKKLTFLSKKRTLFLLLYLTSFGTHVHSSGATDCMGHFNTHRKEFDVCRSVPCFLFKSEEPYVFVSPNLSRLPFRCSERLERFKNPPYGPFFNVIQQVPQLRDAYCVFSGHECSFDDQVEFLQYAHENGGGDHQFIAGGILWTLSYRISPTAIPSVTFITGRILVLGPRKAPQLSARDAWNAVFGPFEKNAWLYIISLIITFIVLRAGLAFLFTKPILWRAVFWNFFGEYETAQKIQDKAVEANNQNGGNSGNIDDSTDEHNDSAHTNISGGMDEELNETRQNREILEFYNKYWMTAFKMFFALTILFYELALFTHVFEILTRPPFKNIRNLNSIELDEFTMLKGAAQEYLFKISADPDNFYEGKEPPWHPQRSLDDVYNALLHEGKYALSYEQVLQYKDYSREVCSELTYYRTNSKAQFYQGSWYYSVDVPQQTRLEIDKTITYLVEHGIMDQLLDHTKSDIDNCGRAMARISFTILILPLIPVTISIMLFILIRIVIEIIWICQIFRPCHTL